jgi:LAS superfamily LD-carboxypeptidase LdcB
MKKIIAVLTLLLAFTINANAQNKKSTTAVKVQDKKELTSVEKGKKDAEELTAYLGLNDTQNADFYRLFEQKHRTLEDKNLSVERKKEVSRIIEAKIRASLDGDQIQKLEKNPELIERLIN